MKKFGLLAALSILTFVMATGIPVQAAQDTGTQMQEDCHARFKTLAGEDGKIVPQEWKQAQYGLGTMKGAGPAPGSAVDFTGVDKNGDGFISEDEYCAWTKTGKPQ